MTTDSFTGPHWNRAALLTIDIQVDTLDGGLFEVRGPVGVLPAIACAAAAARRAHWPIVHVVRLYLGDGSNVDLCRRAQVQTGWHPFAPGSPGSQLPMGLLPDGAPQLDPVHLLAGDFQPLGAGEWAVYKPRWGAFYGTRLDQHLRRLGIDTIVAAGCNYPNCPRATIYEASERDYRIVLLTDAVSGLDEHGRGEMSAIGVTLRTAEDLVTTPELHGPSPSLSRMRNSRSATTTVTGGRS